MKKCVYTSSNCPTCERVEAFIRNNRIDCEVVNISDGGKNAPHIAIFPALYIGGKLMAYGPDVVSRLSA
ncbi:MAG: glutaredoxin domain-containing protein [Vicingaceae bacterium]